MPSQKSISASNLQLVRPNARFIAKFVIVHLVTYFVTGIIAFNTFVGPLYFGEDPLFGSFLVTPQHEEMWGLMVKELVPMQFIRGLLLGMVFYSLAVTLRKKPFKRRFMSFFGFYFVVGFLAGPAIGPGTMEGMVYMQQKFSPNGHFLVFAEMLIQSVLLSAWIAKWMRTDPSADATTEEIEKLAKK